ncbi:MAG: lipid-transfer protein [Pseudomonadota bacterium]
MTNKAVVGGVGMIKFAKPGESEGYEVMSEKAIRLALEDAGLEPDDIEQAYASYIYGDSANGQSGFYRVKRTGIPVFNVNNNCASGSNALFLARQAVESGQVDCALAFGFEEMRPGALVSHWEDRYSPAQPVFEAIMELNPDMPRNVPGAPAMFASAGFEYIEKYGANPDLFAKVAVKTRKHAGQNPYALFTEPITVEDVMASKVVVPPSLTRFMCCPPTCGAAAAIIMTEKFAREKGISNAVRIAGQGMASDSEVQLTNRRNIVGMDMTQRASKQAYEAAGIGPDEVDVVELHDCFTPNEVVTYEGLGLCEEGEATKFVDDGDNTYGGKVVVNPSGGLMSKGHPIGATGLAQCTELVWHLRGDAEKRQVEGAKVALQHNIGIPGSCVVTMYQAM